MKVLIIDDEPMPAKHLQEMIKKYCFEIVSTELCFSPVEGLKLIKDQSFDILFLDVEMPKMDAFDFLAKADLGSQTVVIFTTAYSQYAIDAFKANATHYILKPVMEEELVKAVRKAGKQLRNVSNSEVENAASVNSISVYDGEEYEIIKIDRVIRMEADGSYTKIILQGKELVSSKRIGFYEDKLEHSGFFRCHNSHLINLSHLEKLGKGKGGYLSMANKDVVPLSISKKTELEKRLGM
ncbi:MAG: LytTR family DNA-binding domain-containing protein [Vicingaceae bacterium]